MSKQQKSLDRLCAKPPPQDFTWDELVSALARLGYQLTTNGGSHCRFINPITKDVINVPKPHPDNFVRRYYLRQISEKLSSQGIV